MRKTILLGLALVIALAVASVVEPPLADGPPSASGSPDGGTDVVAAGVALRSFDACEDLAAHLQEEAAERMTAWGLPGATGGPGFGFGGVEVLAEAAAPQAADGAGADQAARSSAPDPSAHSGTNVQVAGVDEPDIVKTDGEILITVSGRTLRILRVTEGGTEPAGTLPLPQDGGEPQLLLNGDRLLVLDTAWRHEPPVIEQSQREGVSMQRIAPGTSLVRMMLVDVSNPDAPEVLSTSETEGSIVSARLIEDRAFVVTSSGPTGVAFQMPMSPEAEDEAREANAEAVQRTDATDWLPGRTVQTADGVVIEDGPAVPCDAVRQPVEFDGFGTLTVQTLELSRDDLVPTSSASVLSSGETVYASTDTLYVATNQFNQMPVEPGPAAMADQPAPEPSTPRTDLHAFAIEPGGVRYVASGSVEGMLLNQFSMDQHEGILRVATTRGAPWGPEAGSDSQVVTLQRDGDQLEQVGQVGGLGRGERIYSVRFLGDRGYVVTFRQIDPLYTLDLSDPANPSVEGELKITGYSAYLHPAGEGRLIGVGQEATTEGRTTGLQVSLFDVSKPDPERLSQAQIQGANSEAEFDHHAFLHWPETGTTVVPIERWGRSGVEPLPAEPAPGDDAVGPGEPSPLPPDEWFAGAAVFDIEAGTVEFVEEISHQEGTPDPARDVRIRRALVIDGRLYTISGEAVVAHDLESLATIGRTNLS